MNHRQSRNAAYDKGCQILMKFESFVEPCKRSYIKRLVREGEEWLGKVDRLWPKENTCGENVDRIIPKMKHMLEFYGWTAPIIDNDTEKK